MWDSPKIGVEFKPRIVQSVFAGLGEAEMATRLYSGMKNAVIKQGALDFSVGPKLQTVWGFREAFVFFLEGLGVTLFIASMILDYVPAMVVGVALLAIAVVLLLSHLGHPLRAWMAIRNVRRSWISRGTAAIGGFIGLGAAYIAVPLVLGIEMAGWWETLLKLVLALAGVFILLYPGFAMAASPAIPFWNNGLLPILSMINGLASGGGVVLVYLAGTELVHQTSDIIWIQLVVLCFLAISVFSYMVTMWNGGGSGALFGRLSHDPGSRAFLGHDHRDRAGRPPSRSSLLWRLRE